MATRDACAAVTKTLQRFSGWQVISMTALVEQTRTVEADYADEIIRESTGPDLPIFCFPSIVFNVST